MGNQHHDEEGMGQSGYTATNRARKVKGMNEKDTCSVFEDILPHCL